MARILVSSHSFLGIPLPPLTRLPMTRNISTKVKFSLHDIPPIHSFDASIDFESVIALAESFMYTITDAAVVSADGTASDSAAAVAQKNGGWFGFISEGMEVVLKEEIATFVTITMNQKG